eukprot:gb/GECH01001990.1/.p1 GENE.gb/GECH01001990.1/~~gb/GECH01001990.1/.p1  ORF type:complete len:103 (+),score=17.79 gb/GECH01001990.1/:1-309(+)
MSTISRPVAVSAFLALYRRMFRTITTMSDPQLRKRVHYNVRQVYQVYALDTTYPMSRRVFEQRYERGMHDAELMERIARLPPEHGTLFFQRLAEDVKPTTSL